MKYKTIISFGSNWYIFIDTGTFGIFKLELSLFVPFVYVILTYVFAGNENKMAGKGQILIRDSP